MTIGDASNRTGLPVKTIRYYEDIGLVVADRQPNGYRDYSEAQIERLSFLKRARDFGFPIEDCRKLLGLYSDEHRLSADVKSLALHHLHELKHKAAEIQVLAETLECLAEQCAGDQAPDCPIITELAGGNAKSSKEDLD
ncbi:MAG: MerR family transcriptional regulator [Alphaproteobacteria bacterium]|nr:MerR family transcriptional regulator [Alphaproteobacteria bacterium]